MSSQKASVTVHLKKLFHAREKDPSVMLKLKLENDEKYQVFDSIMSLVKSYSPPLRLKAENDFMLEAWSTRELLIKRKIVKVLFASVVLHERFVSLYFMPLMTNPLLRETLGQKLSGKLKGTTCFRLKEYDSLLLEEIKELLSTGFNDYQKRGWI